jgi:hemoglobin
MATFGERDSSYRAAGADDGLARLCEAFYRHMDALPEAATIRAMHGSDLALSREKLTVFLAAWLGGPNLYRERFGPISIPRAHAHLADEAERDAWLACMRCAVAEQLVEVRYQPEAEGAFDL